MGAQRHIAASDSGAVHDVRSLQQHVHPLTPELLLRGSVDAGMKDALWLQTVHAGLGAPCLLLSASSFLSACSLLCNPYLTPPEPGACSHAVLQTQRVVSRWHYAFGQLADITGLPRR